MLGSALFASDRIDFQTHVAKGALQSGEALRQAEYSRWDPAAKIDVLPYSVPFLRRIAYDGGAQRSSYYQFDGDLGQVRARYFDLVDNETPLRHRPLRGARLLAQA